MILCLWYQIKDYYIFKHRLVLCIYLCERIIMGSFTNTKKLTKTDKTCQFFHCQILGFSDGSTSFYSIFLEVFVLKLTQHTLLGANASTGRLRGKVMGSFSNTLRLTKTDSTYPKLSLSNSRIFRRFDFRLCLPTLNEHTLLGANASTGRLRGKETLPDERTATAGFMQLIVAPNGYKNCSALWKRRQYPLRSNCSRVNVPMIRMKTRCVILEGLGYFQLIYSVFTNLGHMMTSTSVLLFI